MTPTLNGTEASNNTETTRRLRGERGAFTPWFLVLVMPMMLMAGLVFDGGQVLAGRREALDTAQNAARAGAQAIDGTQIRQGNIAIDPGLANAQDYLASVGHTGTVTVTGTDVTVTVTTDIDMQLLGAIGVESKTVTGTATARIVRGVEGADT